MGDDNGISVVFDVADRKNRRIGLGYTTLEWFPRSVLGTLDYHCIGAAPTGILLHCFQEISGSLCIKDRLTPFSINDAYVFVLSILRLRSKDLNLGILYDLYLQQPAKARAHYEAYLELEPQQAETTRRWLTELERRLSMASTQSEEVQP